MTCEEYLTWIYRRWWKNLVMHKLSQRLKITMELNNKYHTKEEILLCRNLPDKK